MKVFENIERFVRESGEFGQPKAVSDEEFRQGLKKLVESAIPLRKEEGKCISTYNKVRDELPMTSYIAEKESCFGNDFSLGQRVVDSAMLKVIYDDRYSFGFLYWDLIKKYDYLDVYKDPEAPYRKGLIEYAVDFDLEETVSEYNSKSPDERYEYAQEKLRQSKQQVLVRHTIKDDYESALNNLIETCRDGNRESAFAIQEEGKESDSDYSGTSAPTPFAISYIINSKDREKLMAYLHKEIDGKTGQYALVYIQAAIDAGCLAKPSHQDLIKEFGDICKKSNYHKLVQDSPGGCFKRNGRLIKTLTDELKDMIK